MPQIVYVNGRYVPRHQGVVSIEDRGYQFADGVYQVMALIKGHLVDEEAHLEGLEGSLKRLKISKPMTRASLKAVMGRLIALNRAQNAHIYIQITRGVQKRNQLYQEGLKPSLVIVVTPTSSSTLNRAQKIPEIKIVTVPDQRGSFVDIKSLMRIPNVMSLQESTFKGSQDVWHVKEDFITEGSASNAWIVNQSGDIQTHPADGTILNGITRQTLLKLAQLNGLKVVEKPFTLNQAKISKEAFMTASFSLIKAVTEIDSLPIAGGKVGPITQHLSHLYEDYIHEQIV